MRGNQKPEAAQASAILETPSGIWMMKPSANTGIRAPAAVDSEAAVNRCKAGTKKAPNGTRKKRNSSGARSARNARQPSTADEENLEQRNNDELLRFEMSSRAAATHIATAPGTITRAHNGRPPRLTKR